MVRNFLVLWVLLVTSAFSLGQTKSPVKLLEEGERLDSPTATASCFINFADKEWDEVRVQFLAGQTRTVWKTPRPPGISWSPDGKYLAIEDYLDRLATAVLVFRLNYKDGTAELIYQTPYSNSVFDEYYLESWANKGSAMEIKRIDHKTQTVKSRETVELANKKKIIQSIYPQWQFRQ